MYSASEVSCRSGALLPTGSVDGEVTVPGQFLASVAPQNAADDESRVFYCPDSRQKKTHRMEAMGEYLPAYGRNGIQGGLGAGHGLDHRGPGGMPPNQSAEITAARPFSRRLNQPISGPASTRYRTSETFTGREIGWRVLQHAPILRRGGGKARGLGTRPLRHRTARVPVAASGSGFDHALHAGTLPRLPP